MRLALLAAAPIVSILLGFATPATAAETRIPERALAQAEQLRERALADDTGWKVTESLTTEQCLTTKRQLREHRVWTR